MSGANFHYVDTRPRSCPNPVGFYRYKAGLVYKPTLPPPKNGMHVKLHHNLSSRYTRPDTKKEPCAYGPAFRILYKQRQRQKIFSGQASTDLYDKNGVATMRKLTKYDATRHPPESTLYQDALFFPHVVCNKPLYSKQEVQTIVDRLYERKHAEGRCPPVVKVDSNRKTFPAEMVSKMVDVYGSTNRLCSKTPFRNLFRDRVAAQMVCSSSKKITEGELDTMVDRLNDYDPQKWPPNSTHIETEDPGSPEKVKYPPPSTAGHMSSASIEATVDRLYSGRWRSTDTGTPHSHPRSPDAKSHQARSPDIKSPVHAYQREDDKYSDKSSLSD